MIEGTNQASGTQHTHTVGTTPYPPKPVHISLRRHFNNPMRSHRLSQKNIIAINSLTQQKKKPQRKKKIRTIISFHPQS
jgi:hypothetical protein